MKKREKIPPRFHWTDVETVLLDMDGTLLDKHFDDYFWEQYLPEHFCLKHDISLEQARHELLSRYRKVESTLCWTDLDYWSVQLGLDIAQLKTGLNHLIAVHPYVTQFLHFCRNRGKKVYLVTNAHPKTLSIKLEKTAIGHLFDRIICADEIGLAKEEGAFWQRLEQRLGFDRATTMLADDTEKVLRSAEQYGMGLLIYVARPSSRKPVAYSTRYPSIEYFSELIPPPERQAEQLP
ncbi:MAG: GMP/IMP nucleotidase [Desulfobulbaceae bacterium]|nr:GMP/IMP nucleotidase [Desulfobulbaceae bacterium]